MKIQINIGLLKDSPFNSQDKYPFVFDSTAVNDLVQDIKSGNPTCYLISGYRGAGKTSFIKKVEHETSAESKIVFAYVSIPKYTGHAHLLRKLIRSLYHACNAKFVNDDDLLTPVNKLYQSTFHEIQDTSSQIEKTELEETLTLNQVLLIGFIGAFIFSLLNLAFGFLSPAEETSVIGLITSAALTMYQWLRITTKKTIIRSQSNEKLTKSLTDDEITDYHFLNLLNNAYEKGYKIAFVIDELDKLNSANLAEMITQMKPFMVSGKANFLIVAGQDLLYEYKTSLSQDDSPISTLFSRIVHIPLMTVSQLSNILTRLITVENENVPSQEEFQLLLDYLIFHSKRIPRKFVNLIRQSTFWENNHAYLIINTNTSFANKYSQYFNVIQKLDDEDISVNYSDGARDFLIMSLMIRAEAIISILPWSYFSVDDLAPKKDISDKKREFLREDITRLSEQFVEELVVRQVLSPANNHLNPETKHYQKFLEAKSSIGNFSTNQSTSDTTFIQSFYDFRNAVTSVFNYTPGIEQRPQLKLSGMMKRLEKMGAKLFDVNSDQKLRHFVDQADDLIPEPEITKDAQLQLKDRGINLNTYTLNLYRFFISQLLTDLQKSSRISQIHFDVLTGPNDLSYSRLSNRNIAVVDVKFRKNNVNIVEFIEQAIAMFNKISDDLKRTIHIIIIALSTSDQALVERNKFKFNKNILDLAPNISNRIHFCEIPIQSMNRANELFLSISSGLIEAESKTFELRNQPLTQPDIDDHILAEKLDIAEFDYSIVIKPGILMHHWRFGLKFSNTPEIPVREARHEKGYPLYHLGQNPQDNTVHETLYSDGRTQKFGRPTKLHSYSNNQILKFIVKTIGQLTKIDVVDENDNSILNEEVSFESWKYAWVIAWADDHNPFLFHCEINQTPRNLD